MAYKLKFLSVLVAAFFMCRSDCRAAEGGELLWWMISDAGNITGVDEKTGNTVSASDLNINSARIRYESGDDIGYLTLWGLDMEENVFQEPDSIAGVGLPAERFGDLSGLSSSLASYSFVVELGNWVDGTWTKTQMASESVSYQQLVNNGHIRDWSNIKLSPVDAHAWIAGGYHVVPEPSSALMLLVGGAFLALRRRRGRKDC